MMIDPSGDLSCVHVLYGMVVLWAGFEPTLYRWIASVFPRKLC